MENHFNCIYMYTNLVNGKKYIGQAINFNKRHKQHIDESVKNKGNRSYNMIFHKAIRKYGIDNFTVVILKESLPTKRIMNLYECYYIKKYNTLSINGNGYNVKEGGDGGNVFYGKTEDEKKEIREKMSESAKSKIFTDEHKKNMSEARKGEKNKFYGKHHSEETKTILREKNSGKNSSKSKMVVQYSFSGEIIKIWDSMREIERELSIGHGCISRCCNGTGKTSKGYIWRYLTDVSDNDIINYIIKTKYVKPLES